MKQRAAFSTMESSHRVPVFTGCFQHSNGFSFASENVSFMVPFGNMGIIFRVQLNCMQACSIYHNIVTCFAYPYDRISDMSSHKLEVNHFAFLIQRVLHNFGRFRDKTIM